MDGNTSTFIGFLFIVIIVGLIAIGYHYYKKEEEKKEIEELLGDIVEVARKTLLEDVQAFIMSDVGIIDAPIPRVITDVEANMIDSLMMEKPFSNVSKEVLESSFMEDSTVIKFFLDTLELKLFITPIKEYFLLEVANSNKEGPSLHTFRIKNEDGGWDVTSI